jgi:hypothetical protein
VLYERNWNKELNGKCLWLRKEYPQRRWRHEIQIRSENGDSVGPAKRKTGNSVQLIQIIIDGTKREGISNTIGCSWM